MKICLIWNYCSCKCCCNFEIAKVVSGCFRDAEVLLLAANISARCLILVVDLSVCLCRLTHDLARFGIDWCALCNQLISWWLRCWLVAWYIIYLEVAYSSLKFMCCWSMVMFMSAVSWEVCDQADWRLSFCLVTDIKSVVIFSGLSACPDK